MSKSAQYFALGLAVGIFAPKVFGMLSTGLSKTSA